MSSQISEQIVSQQTVLERVVADMDLQKEDLCQRIDGSLMQSEAYISKNLHSQAEKFQNKIDDQVLKMKNEILIEQ